MNIDAFTQILETHGALESSWPEQSREACLQLVTSDEQARQIWNQFKSLERTLDTLQTPSFPGLETRILNQALPPQNPSWIERIIQWLLPNSDSLFSLWRPTFAACLPLVFGLVVGSIYNPETTELNADYEFWDDELIMLSFTDYSDSEYTL